MTGNFMKAGEFSKSPLFKRREGNVIRRKKALAGNRDERSYEYLLSPATAGFTKEPLRVKTEKNILSFTIPIYVY